MGCLAKSCQGYLQTPLSTHDCCSDFCAAATSPLVANVFRISLYTVAYFSTAAAPCTTLGTMALEDQSFIADCR